MILLVLVSFIQAKNKICICNGECLSVCSQRFYLKTSNQQFEKFIMPIIKDKEEIELNFYSKNEIVYFDLNMSYFDTRICLNALMDSKIAVVTLIKGKINKTIKIDPLHRVCFPEFKNPYSNISRSSFQSKLFTRNDNAYHSKSILPRNNPKLSFEKYNSNSNSLDLNSDFVNISCNDLEYVGWHKCYQDNDSKQGSYTNTPNSKATYKFVGIKVQLFSLMKNDSGIATIKIDDEYTYEVDFYREKQEYGIAFTSNVLQYGEHTIEIIHSGKKSHLNEESSIFIVSLLIYLLPNNIGRKLGFKLAKKDKWSTFSVIR